MNKRIVCKKTGKVLGAVAAATGIVAIGAVVASGAAVGAMVEGFKAAGKAVKKALDEQDIELPDAEVVEDMDAESS
ncbi:MAG: hypothetical protein E7290_11070 [Lachnospiraceae bacterium]|nr:hypothetical protein [Lachnospiraceae bacterium]